MKVSIRHTASTVFAKIVVVCLLVLAVSPFTAPFATCDLGAPPLCTNMSGDGESTSKIVAEAALAVFTVVLASPLRVLAARIYVSAVARTTALHASLFPLRV